VFLQKTETHFSGKIFFAEKAAHAEQSSDLSV